jgi:hypothetical protein
MIIRITAIRTVISTVTAIVKMQFSKKINIIRISYRKKVITAPTCFNPTIKNRKKRKCLCPNNSIKERGLLTK